MDEDGPSGGASSDFNTYKQAREEVILKGV